MCIAIHLGRQTVTVLEYKVDVMKTYNMTEPIYVCHNNVFVSPSVHEDASAPIALSIGEKSVLVVVKAMSSVAS